MDRSEVELMIKAGIDSTINRMSKDELIAALNLFEYTYQMIKNKLHQVPIPIPDDEALTAELPHK